MLSLHKLCVTPDCRGLLQGPSSVQRIVKHTLGCNHRIGTAAIQSRILKPRKAIALPSPWSRKPFTHRFASVSGLCNSAGTNDSDSFWLCMALVHSSRARTASQSHATAMVYNHAQSLGMKHLSSDTPQFSPVRHPSVTNTSLYSFTISL